MNDPDGFVFITHPGPGVPAAPPPTVTAETVATFAAVDAQLRTHGLDFSHVVKTRLWYTQLSDFPAMNAIRVPFYAGTFRDESWPASSGFVTGGRGGQDPQFEIEVIAHPAQSGRSTDAAIRQWGDVRPPYSHANTAGDVVFLSGQGGYHPDGTLVAPGAGAQAEGAVAALERVLAAEGLRPVDVLGVTVFTAPPADAERSAVEAVVARFLEPAACAPSVAWVDAQELSFPGMIVEIELVAVHPSDGDRGTIRRFHSGPGDDEFEVGAASGGGIAVATASGVTARARDLVRALLHGVHVVGPVDGGLLTLWFPATASREKLLTDVEDLLGAGIALSLLPMPVRGGDERLVAEFTGSTC